MLNRPQLAGVAFKYKFGVGDGLQNFKVITRQIIVVRNNMTPCSAMTGRSALNGLEKLWPLGACKGPQRC